MFSIGDEVILVGDGYNTNYHPTHSSNKDAYGIITSLYNDEGRCYVIWSIGNSNSYPNEDLDYRDISKSDKKLFSPGSLVIRNNGSISTVKELTKSSIITVDKKINHINSVMPHFNISKFSNSDIDVIRYIYTNLNQREFYIDRDIFLLNKNINSLLNDTIKREKEIVIEEVLSRGLKKIQKYLGDVMYNEKLLECNRSILYFKDKIEDCNNIIRSNRTSIKDYYKKRMTRKESLKKSIKTLQSLNKHKSIDSITIYNDYLYITTKELYYTDEVYKNIPIGRFKIRLYIPKNYDDYRNPEAVNIDWSCNRRYFHPCIKEFSMCLGENVSSAVKSSLLLGDIDAAVYIIINFLEEPNYNTPYKSLYNFCEGSYKVTSSPKKEDGWFSTYSWERLKISNISLKEHLKNIKVEPFYKEPEQPTITVDNLVTNDILTGTSGVGTYESINPSEYQF